MRFGCCVPPQNVAILAEAGFDFCELTASTVQPFDDEATALPALRQLSELALPIEAFNVLIPPSLPLLGPQADLLAVQNYLQRAFTRMVQVGGAVVVLGSGGARRIPDGMPRDQALDGLAQALSIAAEEAHNAGITLVLEHLNQGECNVFTSLHESYTFAVERQIPHLAVLADLHHLELEHESFDAVREAEPLLRHVHVADGGRRAPGKGGYDYAGFMRTLKQIGYDARISAECGWDDLASQARESLEFMRESWQNA
jgi:D-psicose/D-tagatose/L-ribulose 3-epimerase